MMSEDDQSGARFLQFLMDGLTPCIIITSGNDFQIYWVVVIHNNFPVLQCKFKNGLLELWFDYILLIKVSTNRHDVCVLSSVYGFSVMILSEKAEWGKSETALDLIRDGQVPPCDDRKLMYNIFKIVFMDTHQQLRRVY